MRRRRRSLSIYARWNLFTLYLEPWEELPVGHVVGMTACLVIGPWGRVRAQEFVIRVKAEDVVIKVLRNAEWRGGQRTT